MKERLLKLTSSHMSRLWLLVVLVMTCVSASAAVEWNTFETETTYKFDTKVTTYYKFTPTEDGIFYIYYSNGKPTICTAADDNGPLTGYEDTDGSWISYAVDKFSWFRDSYNGTFYTSRVEASVKANTTYYISIPDAWNGGTFIGHLEGNVTELKLKDQNFESDKTFNITDTRYGQLELTFNIAAAADEYAYLKVGNYPTDANKEEGKIEVRSGSNTGALIFNLKDSLVNWMDKGYYKEGDDVTLTITGIHAKTDESIIYGTDGTLVMTFKAPGKPHNLVASTMPDPFSSYWTKGDKKGIAVLEFDYDVMSGEGQTCKVGIRMGSGEASDAYTETLDADKISVDGKNLYIDFTDKIRTYEAMGLKTQYGTMTIMIYNVMLADGSSPYAEGNAKSGSYTYTVKFEEKNYSNLTPDFTPANGEKLTDDLKIYFSNKDAFTFSGVKFTYQDQEDRRQQEIVTEGITSEASGKTGIEYTIPVSEAMKAGKNIRLSFVDLVSADGLDHSDLCDGIKFNPGDELISDLAPVSVSVKNGDVVSSFDKLTLTFDEEVAINKPAGRVQVLFTDKTTTKNIQATIAVDENDAKTVVITPATELTNTHSYEITVSEAVIVNKQYQETSGKYGNFMTEESYSFSINKNKGVLDFVATPVEGSIVKELSTITCKTDQTKSSSTNWLSYSGNTEPWVYVKLVNEQGVSIARADIKSCDDNDGFTLTFDPAITTPGKYTVVMTDSVYCLGEGYEVTPNEYQVEFEYTVVEGPKAELPIFGISPADESTVESLESISICTERTPLYCVATPITAFNRADRKSYTGMLTLDPESDTYVQITFDQEITAEGDYTVDIPEGIFGDKEWYDSDYLAGTCNAAMTLYYTVGEATPEGDLFTTDPAAGSTVTSLQTITISVGDGTSDYMTASGKVTITGPDGTVLFNDDPETIWPDDWTAPVYQYTITLDEAATAEGVYTMTIPDGYFNDADGEPVAGTTITWTIGGGDTPEPADFFTADPANGSHVDALSTIGITFTNTSEVSLGGGMITVKKDGEQVKRIDADLDWDVYNKINVSYTATEPGVYTFEFPEGYVVDGSYESIPAFTLTYYVGVADGINGISASKMENVKIYTIDGKLIKSTNGKKGAYIINGKKVILK